MSSLNPVLPIGVQVGEVIRGHQRVNSRESRRRTVEILEKVQLSDAERIAGNYPHELSGGMRQRVAIAMALANNPELVIADEPTTALDVTTQAEILSLLRNLQKEKEAALLFITHDFGIVSAICDRVAVLYAGEIDESAPTEKIFRDSRHPYTQGLLASVPVLGEPEKIIHPISGLPPASHQLPASCLFAERCPAVLDACREKPVSLKSVAKQHAVRCIRWEDEPVRNQRLWKGRPDE